MSEAALVRMLCRELHQRGFATLTEVPFWLRRIDVVAYWPDCDKWVAVEAKLTSWRRALEQAKAYQLCVPDVYVAMPEEYAHRADVRAFDAAGIGLWAVADGDLIELIEPRPCRAYRSAFHAALVRACCEQAGLDSPATEGDSYGSHANWCFTA